MLELVVDYARERGIALEPGFKSETARWALVFDARGKFLNVADAALDFPCCPEMSFTLLRAGSEPRSHVFIESAETAALFSKDDDDERAQLKRQGKHTWFVKMLREVTGIIPELVPIADTLDDRDALESMRTQLVEHKAKPGDKVTVAILGRDPIYPVEDCVWHDWWRKRHAELVAEAETGRGGKRVKPGTVPCLVSGEVVVPVRIQPKIKGLADVGGLPTGDALASYKQDSFCSYGLKQSANAAMSETVAADYKTGLDDLIRNHGRRLAAAKVVHWYRRPLENPDDDLAEAIFGREDTGDEFDARVRARALLGAIRAGKRPDLADNEYYALTLSANSGRLVMRDFMEGPFEQFVGNVTEWFDHLEIVRRDGAGTAPVPKFLAVLGATVRDLGDLNPPFVAKMWRIAARCEAIPREALAQALARVKVDIIDDRPANHARLGLLIAFHVRQS